MVTKLGDTLSGARPVAASVICGVCISSAICLTSCQDVVGIRFFTNAVDQIAFFSDRIVFRDKVTCACKVESVAMQLRQVSRDHGAASIMPRSFPMRSLAFTAGVPSPADVLRYARQVREPPPAAAASF